MEILRTIEEVRESLELRRAAGKIIGFVPTMGSLHEGHLSLLDIAKKKADVLVASIYVNPIQFGVNEDFKSYPRDEAKDIELCESRGVDFLFMPTSEELFPEDFSTFVKEDSLSSVLCGVSRPTHFRGVTTICTKLFNIVQPKFAVFGQKDAQQAAIIKKIVKDLNMPIEIEVAPIIRAEDGLALSSRNVKLTDFQYSQSLKISKALVQAKELLSKGNTQSNRIVAEVIHLLSTSRTVRVIYVSVVDRVTMKEVHNIEAGKHVLCIAVWVDQVRLIDNIEL